jgi:hypothetical protein
VVDQHRGALIRQQTTANYNANGERYEAKNDAIFISSEKYLAINYTPDVNALTIKNLWEENKSLSCKAVKSFLADFPV